MRSIDRGFYDQYMIKKPSGWPYIPSETFRHSEKRRQTLGPIQYAPPRWLDLVVKLEQRNLLDRWIYRRHLEPLLSSFDVTSKNGFDTVWRERSELKQVGLLRWKDGLVRFISEYTGKMVIHNQGVLELDSFASKVDAQQFFTAMSFDLGANGGTLIQYPIPGLNHRYAIVGLHEEKAFYDFLSRTNYERSQERRFNATAVNKYGKTVQPLRAFAAMLHHDYSPLDNILPYSGVSRMVDHSTEDGPRASSLSVRDQKLDDLQKKLNSLLASLSKK